LLDAALTCALERGWTLGYLRQNGSRWECLLTRPDPKPGYIRNRVLWWSDATPTAAIEGALVREPEVREEPLQSGTPPTRLPPIDFRSFLNLPQVVRRRV